MEKKSLLSKSIVLTPFLGSTNKRFFIQHFMYVFLQITSKRSKNLGGWGGREGPPGRTCPTEPLRRSRRARTCQPPPSAPAQPWTLGSPPAGHQGMFTAEHRPHQPTQSGDQGACLAPQDTLGSRRGWGKGSSVCVV